MPIEVQAYDETNSRIRPRRLAAMIEAAGAGMVMLVGVQSNQMPRALDIARPLRERGIQVAVGGFHVSGVLSTLDGVDADLDRAKAMGVSVFAGEAEGRLEEVLRDAAAGALKPLYDFIQRSAEHSRHADPVDGSRARPAYGGPRHQFRCGTRLSISVLFLHHHQCPGTHVTPAFTRRHREDRARQLRTGLARVLHHRRQFRAQSATGRPILDRLIHLRENERFNISFIIQVDTLCHRLPNFIEKCARAGVRRVFIGLENINPANLAGAKKKQNKITEYRTMLLAWKSARVITYAGYIIGFPNDTFDSIMHDIDVIKRELPIDLLEFFYLTPLPGSEDHLKLVRAGTPLDPDMNNYDLNHVCVAHPLMSRADCDRAHRMAWQRYYTTDHCETIMRRVASSRANASQALFLLTWFKGSIDYREHPSTGKRLHAAEIEAATAGRGCRSSRSGASIRNTGPRLRPSSFAGERCICGCAASISASSTTRTAMPIRTSR